MRKPREITITRHAPPASCRVAWTAEPKPSAFTGNVKPEEKDRALAELKRSIITDGYDPADCEIIWKPIDIGWGWVARVKEAA